MTPLSATPTKRRLPSFTAAAIAVAVALGTTVAMPGQAAAAVWVPPSGGISSPVNVSLSSAPTASTPTSYTSVSLNLTGSNLYAWTIGFFTTAAYSSSNLLIGGSNTYVSNVSGYPDPVGARRWEPIWSGTLAQDSGIRFIDCTVGPDTASSPIDYEINCTVHGNYAWTILIANFRVASTASFRWEISVVPSPARQIGSTRSSNGFTAISPLQCTWGAEQMMRRATGYYMNVNGDAWTWANSTNPSGWTHTTTPLAKSVGVLNKTLAGNAYGHVFWVQGVEYGTDGYTYLHTIEMNMLGHPNMWFSERRRYASGMSFILAP